MRGKLFESSISVLVVSCLLIAYSGSATDLTALIGFMGLVLSLILVMTGLFYKEEHAVPLEISAEEKLKLHQEFRRNGEVSAIKMLRESHPNLSIKNARDAIRTLIK